MKNIYFIKLAALIFVIISIFLISTACKNPKVKLILQNPNIQGPNYNCETVSCQTLLSLIEESKESIDFAIYGYRNQEKILIALENAKNRGVLIRGILDKDIYNKSQYSETYILEELLKNTKSDYISDLKQFNETKKDDTVSSNTNCLRPPNTKGPLSCFGTYLDEKTYLIMSQASQDTIKFTGNIMHNKFFIFDNKIVWTGSANISDSGIGGYDANVGIIVEDEEIAKWYKEEFEEMFLNERFHKNKLIHYGEILEKQYSDDRFIKILFSPKHKSSPYDEDSIFKDSIIPLIINAKSKINISIFHITHKEITTELINAKKRGIEIRIILDSTGAENDYSKHEILRTAGILVKIEDWPGKMHAKAASFDGKNLALGSMNWTSSADNSNDENLVILNNFPNLVEEYNQWFDNLWNKIPDGWLTQRPLAEGKFSINSCNDKRDNDFDNKIDLDDPDCYENSIGYAIDAQPKILYLNKSYKPTEKNKCPDYAPIKAMLNKGIYYLPKNSNYEKVNPQICFVTEKEAIESGFIISK